MTQRPSFLSETFFRAYAHITGVLLKTPFRGSDCLIVSVLMLKALFSLTKGRFVRVHHIHVNPIR